MTFSGEVASLELQQDVSSPLRVKGLDYGVLADQPLCVFNVVRVTLHGKPQQPGRTPAEDHLDVAPQLAQALRKERLQWLHHRQELGTAELCQRLGSAAKLSGPSNQIRAGSGAAQGSSAVRRASPPIAAVMVRMTLKFCGLNSTVISVLGPSNASA